MTKSKQGAPTVMTKDTLQLLREAFTWGCTDTEACCYADISTSTLYNYCKENPDFLELKNKLKDMPIMKAKKIQFDELENNSISQANKVIDRKEGQKIKQEVSGVDGNPIVTTSTFNFIPVGNKD
jgi:hypothetical protein